MASVNPSLQLNKAAAFKGGTRIFSNRYHFSGGTPADGTHWTTLKNAVIAVEKTVYDSQVEIVESIGYAAGSDVPVFSAVESTTGTLSPGGNDYPTPREVAALIRWSTAAKSTKNHPIYAFSYIHGAFYDHTVSGDDKLASGQKTALQTYAGDWVSGFSDGTNTYIRATPSGHATTGFVVEEYLTHRDFPYRSSV